MPPFQGKVSPARLEFQQLLAETIAAKAASAGEVRSGEKPCSWFEKDLPPRNRVHAIETVVKVIGLQRTREVWLQARGSFERPRGQAAVGLFAGSCHRWGCLVRLSLNVLAENKRCELCRFSARGSGWTRNGFRQRPQGGGNWLVRFS